MALSDDNQSLSAKGRGKRKKAAKRQAARELLFQMMPFYRVGLENTDRCEVWQENETAENTTKQKVDVVKEHVEDHDTNHEDEMDEDAKEDLIRGSSCKKGTRPYHIRFKEPLTQIHPICMSQESKEARSNYWMTVARDAERFRFRISNSETVISRCFEEDHRRRMRAYIHGQNAS